MFQLEVDAALTISWICKGGKSFTMKRMKDMKRSWGFRSMTFGILGFGVGAVVSFIAFLLTGAGHGWGSIIISWTSLVGAPLAGIAWAHRYSSAGILLSIIVLIGGLVGDYKLWSATIEEGVFGAKYVWELFPILIIIWGALFAS